MTATGHFANAMGELLFQSPAPEISSNDSEQDTLPDQACITDESEFEDSGDEGINQDFFKFWLAGEKQAADDEPPTPSKPYDPNDIEFWDEDVVGEPYWDILSGAVPLEPY
ncbi:hypothetical protein AVEN_168904-1 [Araneus ventricosus]|uniref:Uncharacterized protein n=1 Tax=Araneus ventricosus TaxID=182803 RepID=A0A4Y2U4S7_ARAVE|nr:hypothetical protein AVEN_168904-1 [Araneus ventricosus]